MQWKNVVNKRVGRDGFTLIELLVVIAIISLLAAILFPVFARARENARRTSCLSNLKQMGLGVQQYLQDYDSQFPPVDTTGTGTPPDGKTWYTASPTTWYWPQLIFPYTKAALVYVCPNTPAAYWFSPKAPFEASYGGNLIIMSRSHISTRLPVKDSTIISPATTYLMMDAGSIAMAPYYTLHPESAASYIPGTGPGTASNLGELAVTSIQELKDDARRGRHFGGVNVGFADGHVKWLQSEVVLREAQKYPGTGHMGDPPVPPTQKSAWNPFVDNSN